MEYDELVEALAQAAGVEKAETVVDDAISSIGLEDKGTYSTEDVIDICEAIQHRESGYLSMIANDISVDLQAERRFKTLLANVPEPAVVASFDGEQPVVSMVNAAFEETFGYAAAEITGQRLSDLIVPDDADLSAAALWARSGGESGTEVERTTADGQRRTLLFRSAIVRRESGETEGYGIYTDITERKRRERTLKHQNEQLERFVDLISHDLRNPLEVSFGRIELALEETTDEDVREHLETAREANERMETLIEDLLSLAKQGQVVGHTERVSLEAVAREAWGHVETGSATLSVEADATVEADPGRLSALFENLFRNSVEHGSTDSRTQSDDSVEHGSADSGVTVTLGTTDAGFYVADDGQGIDPEHRDTVFEEGFTPARAGPASDSRSSRRSPRLTAGRSRSARAQTAGHGSTYGCELPHL
jgi:PAS domain S-box-containing protein